MNYKLVYEAEKHNVTKRFASAEELEKAFHKLFKRRIDAKAYREMDGCLIGEIYAVRRDKTCKWHFWLDPYKESV